MKPDDFQSSSSGQVRRTQQGYWYFLPDPLPPELVWTPEIITVLGEAERNLGRLAALSRTLPSAALLIQPFARQEAVLSSRIEGTRASLEDVYQYEAGQISLLGGRSDVKEVHNYVQALDYGLERLADLPISLRLMREVHAILMEGVRGGTLTPGEFRRSQNWIGPPGSTLASATYVPPPVEEIYTVLYDLEKYIHANTELPSLVRIGLIHYQFEAIHPFLDGNGRMGRLLISLLLCAWDLLPQPLLYLSAYFESRRPEYYGGLLSVSQNGAWERWLLFFLKGVNLQSVEGIARVEYLQQLRESLRAQLQKKRNADRLFEVLDLLFERPLLNINQLADAMGISYPSAKRYVERFVQLGILREVTGQARNRVYRSDPIFKALGHGV